MSTDRRVLRHPAVPVSNQAVLRALGIEHLSNCQRIVLELTPHDFPRLTIEQAILDPVNGPAVDRAHWRFEAPL